MDNRMTITRKQKWNGKQPCGRFKQLINNISLEKTWTRLRKGISPNSRTKVIRTNHIKTRIDKTQQNSKCRLCGDRDETINHIISECCKSAHEEYKTRHDWVGKGDPRGDVQEMKFDHTNKWYWHNPTPVQENDPLVWDFNMQTDHLIPTRRPDLIIIKKEKKKEKLQNCRLCCPDWLQNKTERMSKEGFVPQSC